ncbi:Cyclin-dependent protein kinase inhibitor SMR3 [Morella rubra]|uniref:Cyclin-dependent protein kinase inhibitor SMR3 n=1 Tax=Morella rubra TaxID=262757 RepID=A0A6A1WTB7_9ROSI|nr:Cyclin-dependent protein kinase inhibitor SMR3 [Morella rubra]
MGTVSDSQMFLISEKDPNAMEFNFRVRPALEFRDESLTVPPETYSLQEIQGLKKEEEEDQERERERERAQDEEKEDKCNTSGSSLRLKILSPGEFRDVEDDNDGFKTPTALDHKISAILECPPAPRKPRPTPLTKRKAVRRRILLDLSNEIESLFPPVVGVYLSGKTKKIRQGSDETK